MRKKGKIKIQYNKIIFLISIILACIVAFFLSKTMSKYVIQAEDINVQEATNFYFESETADNTGNKTYYLDDWEGVSDYTINFDICNFENSLLYTEENIEYTIEANIIDLAEDTINDEDLISVEVLNTIGNSVTGTQSLQGNMLSSNSYVLNISAKSAIEEGKSFQIQLVIKSTSPYTEELVTNYIITTTETEEAYKTSIYNSDNGEYAYVYLQVISGGTDITLTYDNTKLSIDNSCEILQGISINTTDSLSTLTIPSENLVKYTNYTIYFIKNTTDTIILGTDIVIES